MLVGGLGKEEEAGRGEVEYDDIIAEEEGEEGGGPALSLRLRMRPAFLGEPPPP